MLPRAASTGREMLGHRALSGGKPKMIAAKYGASTTWMGKLDYRLNAGRPGGCPVLALGITPHLITDLGTL